VLPSAEVVRRISEHHRLEPVGANHPGEVAERWRYRDGTGEVGVISSVTQAFCRDCNRIRLSTEGALYTCLFAQSGHELKPLLRAGASDDELRNEIAAVWRARADRYSEIRTAETANLPKVEMSYIGG
ncbi:MAG TPA: GTP 3',8-cyclase MoaA, partial [Burkholderiales bacterium]|nr:GTP 3',8-cyclase MoaA [Burkholderiales bacterium]